MTLDEAIIHAREVAERNRKQYKNCPSDRTDIRYQTCEECAEEHKQLAEWLEELKMYKSLAPRELVSEKQKNDRAIECSKGFDYGFKTGYNKATDDYADKAIKIVYEANNRDRNPQPRDMVADIHYKLLEIAEQLKAGGENDK